MRNRRSATNKHVSTEQADYGRQAQKQLEQARTIKMNQKIWAVTDNFKKHISLNIRWKLSEALTEPPAFKIWNKRNPSSNARRPTTNIYETVPIPLLILPYPSLTLCVGKTSDPSLLHHSSFLLWFENGSTFCYSDRERLQTPAKGTRFEPTIICTEMAASYHSTMRLSQYDSCSSFLWYCLFSLVNNKKVNGYCV